MKWDAIQLDAKRRAIYLRHQSGSTAVLTQPGPWGVRSTGIIGLAASWISLAYMGKDFPTASGMRQSTMAGHAGSDPAADPGAGTGAGEVDRKVQADKRVIRTADGFLSSSRESGRPVAASVADIAGMTTAAKVGLTRCAAVGAAPCFILSVSIPRGKLVRPIAGTGRWTPPRPWGFACRNCRSSTSAT
jgi:hypothetical protein